MVIRDSGLFDCQCGLKTRPLNGRAVNEVQRVLTLTFRVIPLLRTYSSAKIGGPKLPELLHIHFQPTFGDSPF